MPRTAKTNKQAFEVVGHLADELLAQGGVHYKSRPETLVGAGRGVGLADVKGSSSLLPIFRRGERAVAAISQLSDIAMTDLVSLKLLMPALNLQKGIALSNTAQHQRGQTLFKLPRLAGRRTTQVNGDPEADLFLAYRETVAPPQGIVTEISAAQGVRQNTVRRRLAKGIQEFMRTMTADRPLDGIENHKAVATQWRVWIPGTAFVSFQRPQTRR
jgi:hypothetical protein